MKKLLAFLASISPGIFLIGYNIGTGSITTMAASGASYGMTLIWPLLISCLFTYFLIITFGKYTAVTGNTALHSFKTHFGKPVALFVLASLLFSEYVSCMGVMAIVVQTLQEWSRPMTASGEGLNPILMAAIFGLLLFTLFWQGQHKSFERLLAVFVGLMGVCFILTMFLVEPSWEEIRMGLVPQRMEGADQLLIMAGMVGTTMGSILFVVRSILVQEKGWTVRDLRLERRDALISVSLMFILSVAVMAAAAGTLHPQGLKLDNAIDMVQLLEPLAGRFAVSLFVVGIVAAGLSSFFPIALLGPWLISDYLGEARDMRAPRARALVGFAMCLGLVVPIFGGRPVGIMLLSQAVIAIASPLVLILMLVLVNRRSLMGAHVFKPRENVLFLIITAFSLYIAGAGIIGLWG